MFKSRNFFIGLGIGLIISSMILMLYTNSTNKTISDITSRSDITITLDKSNELTLDELKGIAADKDLFLYTKTDIDNLKASLTDEVKNELSKKNNPPTVDNSNSDNANKDSAISDSTNTTSEDTNANKTNNDNSEKVIYFSIPDGMRSEQVADYLVEIGILKEKNKFLDILEKKHLATKIIAGTYKYDKVLITEELVKLLTEAKQ